MKIAIQAADLDARRIDGTRVYLWNVLRQLGKIAPQDEFFIYHKQNFNPELTPPAFSNYRIKELGRFPFWTQTRLAFELQKNSPEALWMPMHNIPLVKKKNLQTTVTIHDLAFKYFPEHFPLRDRTELSLLTDLAIKRSDKIIAVSESTKKDILKFYPQIKEAKIHVIHHGFDQEFFSRPAALEIKEELATSHKLQAKKYILYVGALQPRKNLERLIDAFSRIKKNFPEMKLVLAGGKAWLWEGILQKAQSSPFQKDIIFIGQVGFEKARALYQQAAVFAFPSLYEGFGIPILEALAAGVPVVTANNSSLPEVGGDAALYADAENSEDLAEKIGKVLKDPNLQQEMIAKGKQQLQKFSWEKCAQETLKVIKS